MAEANGDETDCANCPDAEPKSGITYLNAQALETWRLLDMFGRGLDGFSGVPLPIRLESINLECDKSADPEGLKWRVCAIEEKIYSMRIDKFKEKQDKKGK